MSEEFIWKACKSFRRRVDTIIKNMVATMSKFTVLCLSSYFVVNISKLELILFCNRVVYYHTRMFLNLFLHPVYGFCSVFLCKGSVETLWIKNGLSVKFYLKATT